MLTMDAIIDDLDFIKYLETLVHDHHSFVKLFLCRQLVKSFVST